ncbi:hypothetical protein LSH36_512g01006 [Paralvinella palmiformis]|uniref:Cadherin domain-containing protein n=1 Tax=Paralvinella palmiformis TaxID=53620 RepID=A0AAD9J7Z1_9ANNE|nr:hypothetical protein LSH36_512g01006 [Paralvinella palmiformis]
MLRARRRPEIIRLILTPMLASYLYIYIGPAPAIHNLDNVVDVWENEATWWTTIFTVLASHPSSRAEENGLLIVDPSTAVQLTFNYDTSQPFNFTTDANRSGVLTVMTERSFDFESEIQYLLPIAVTGLYQTASGTLTVNILDRNDPHLIDNLDSSTSASVLDTSCQTNQVPS